MNIVICPYCKQDGVWRVSIDGFADKTFYMCFECDTVWDQNEKVMDGTGSNFELFMEKNGKKPDWTIINKIEPLEKK